jgi:hypothetical protein
MANYTTPQLNIQHLEEQCWSPEDDTRLQRTPAAKEMKVRSLDNNSRKLRGGTFILNGHVNAVTLSFCYVADKKNFGLTVARLADYIDQDGTVIRVGLLGDKLFAFDSDTPDANHVYAVVEIGTIVSIHRATDLLILEVRNGIHMEPLVLDVSRGQSATILEAAISVPADPNGSTSTLLTALAGFGAQRRGTVGRVVSQVGSNAKANEQEILQDDLCIQSFDPSSGQVHANGRKQLTDVGDCGTIFLDVYAKPWGMHHVLYYQGSSREYTSCCVPFHKILESRQHQDYFPHNDTSVIRQTSPLIRPSSSTKENGQSIVGDRIILDKPLIFKTETKELSPFRQEHVYSHQPKIVKTKTVPLTAFQGKKEM